jgi:hypothetical protein
MFVADDRFPLFQFRYDALPNRAVLPDLTRISAVKITPQDVERALVPLAGSHKRVWLAEVEKNLQDADGLLADWLDRRSSSRVARGLFYNREPVQRGHRAARHRRSCGDYAQSRRHQHRPLCRVATCP